MDNIEIWKPVKGICDFSKKRYCKILRCEVSTLGNVRTIFKNGKINILKPQKNSVGYKQVFIQNRWYRVHRLVAEAFLPNPNNLPEVDHIIPLTCGGTDEVTNLRWCTHEGNMNNNISKINNSTSKKGKSINKLWKKVYQYTLDNKLVKIWNSIKECGNYGFDRNCISSCCRGKHKTHKGHKWSFEPL